MAAFMLIINIVIILVAIVLIVSVLMQQGNAQGLGVISGGAETFFGKSKAKSYEGKLELITKISASVFTVLVIILAATYNRTSTSVNIQTPAATVAPAVEATAAPAESAAATALPEATAAAETAATVAPALTEATVAPAVTEAPAAVAPAVTEAPAALATEAPAATPAA